MLEEGREGGQESDKGLISIASAIDALDTGLLWYEASSSRVEKLSGGLTNDNVLVTLHDENDKERRIVLRRFLTKTSKHLHYKRHEEYTNSCIAQRIKGIGAPIIGYIPPTEIHGGVIALEYINGKTLSEEDVQSLCASQNGRLRLIGAIKRLHSGPALFKNNFDPFQARSRYEEEVRKLSGGGIPWPGYNEAVQQIAIVEKYLAATREDKVDCHNDLLSANFLESSSPSKLTIIDWELSGLAEPSWEIGNFISENGLDGNETVVTSLISTYWQDSSDSSDYIKLKVNRAKLFSLISKITWAAWGAVLHFLDKDDEFDYKSWSTQRLQKAQSLLADQDKLHALLQIG